MQILYPLMYLIYSLKYVLDVLDRFVWKICWEWSADCLRALLTKSAIIVFTTITRMMMCMLVGVCGWAECGTGQPTHHSKKYWQQLLFGSNQSPAPYCPFTLPLSTCYLCFLHWHICVLCSYAFPCFPDQTNLIPLSLFTPFQWTNIVFCSYYYLTLKSTFVLHFCVLHEYHEWGIVACISIRYILHFF